MFVKRNSVYLINFCMGWKSSFYIIVFLLLLICCKSSVAPSGYSVFHAQTDTLFRQAAACQQAQNFVKAISLYKRLLDRRPPSDEAVRATAPLVKEALMQLMYCYFFSGQRGSAAVYYTDLYADTANWIVRQYPRNVEICLGYSLYEAARLGEAVTMIEKALARPEAGISANELYADYGIAGAIYNQTGDVRKAIACTEKCAALLRTLDDKTDLINALGNLIYQYQQVGDFDRSLAAYEELIALKEVRDNAYHRCVAEVNIISLFEEWGLEGEVEKHLDSARRAARLCGITEALLRVKNLETALLLAKEDAAGAALAVDTLNMLLRKDETESIYQNYYQDFRLIVRLLNAPAGQHSAAVQAAFRRVAELQTIPLDRIHCDVCFYLGKALARKGYRAQAIEAYERCVPYIRENHLLNLQRKVYQALARLYGQQQDYATASRYYELYDTANNAFTERRNAGLMSQFRVKYETREKEQANQLLRSELRLQQRSIQYYTVAGIAAFLFFVLLLIWGVMHHRTLRMQHVMDARQHELDLLHQQEAERTITMQEEQLRQMLQERLELNRKYEELREKLKQSNTQEQKKKLMEILAPCLLAAEEEQRFRQQFTLVHPTLLAELRKRFPLLSRNEELLLMLIRLNLTNEEIALALGINRKSVNTSRFRLRKKLSLSGDVQLEEFISSFS